VEHVHAWVAREYSFVTAASRPRHNVLGQLRKFFTYFAVRLHDRIVPIIGRVVLFVSITVSIIL